MFGARAALAVLGQGLIDPAPRERPQRILIQREASRDPVALDCLERLGYDGAGNQPHSDDLAAAVLLPAFSAELPAFEEQEQGQ